VKIVITAHGFEEAEQELRDAGRKVEDVTWAAMVNTAKQVQDRLTAMVVATFDRPTRLIVTGLRIVKSRATQEVAVGWKDDMGRGTIEHNGRLLEGAAALALVPHIQGGARSPKGMERRLRESGLIGRDEWLVPSRTSPVLDQNGNVKGSEASKMLADIGSYVRAGDPNKTGSGRRKSKRGVQYVWGKVGKTRGIYKVGRGSGWRLVMLVVRRPMYRKTFDFYGIGQAEADRVFDATWWRVFGHEMDKAKAVNAQP
jgi:hypothetical protein